MYSRAVYVQNLPVPSCPVTLSHAPQTLIKEKRWRVSASSLDSTRDSLARMSTNIAQTPASHT